MRLIIGYFGHTVRFYFTHHCIFRPHVLAVLSLVGISLQYIYTGTPSSTRQVVFKVLARVMCMNKRSCYCLRDPPKVCHNEAIRDYSGAIFTVHKRDTRRKLSTDRGLDVVRSRHECVGNYNGKQEEADPPGEAEAVSDADNVLAIRRVVEQMWELKVRDDEEKAHAYTWQDVAAVVDRFLFWLFLMVTVIFTLVMLHQYLG